MKVLYVCPWAHRAGHYPEATIKESSTLLSVVDEIRICTFSGILGQDECSTIPHSTAVSSNAGIPLKIITKLFGFRSKLKMVIQLIEYIATLFVALRSSKKLNYDVIYLRDGDPFIFIPLLFGLVYKNRNWAIYLIRPVGNTKSPYSRFINNPLWKPIYQKSLSNNNFVFICENSITKKHFNTIYLDGILVNMIHVLPLGVEKAEKHIDKTEAREYLGLPNDNATIFLHFGALHEGKDIVTIVSAIKNVPNAMLVHAGKITYPIDLTDLVKHMGLADRIIIKDYYIPEVEKQYLFAAANAAILSYKLDFEQTASMVWETARYRLPAITSDCGDLGTLAKQHGIGLVFQAEESTSLSHALTQFIHTSQEDRQKMQRNCDRFCKEFSFDNWSKKLLQIITPLS